jgi:hypothetical protein
VFRFVFVCYVFWLEVQLLLWCKHVWLLLLLLWSKRIWQLLLLLLLWSKRIWQQLLLLRWRLLML